MSQPPSPQPYPQQPPPPPQPSGQLRLVLRKPPGLGSGTLIRPAVTIDNYPAPANWGENAYPVVAGQHQVQASATYMWAFGHAQLPVVIHPGQSVTVHYSPPMITFIAGKMGFEPQPRPGSLVTWLVLGFAVLIVVVAILVGVLTT